MHPQLVSLTDVGDVHEGIEGTVDRRSCRGIHEEWNQTLRREREQKYDFIIVIL